MLVELSSSENLEDDVEEIYLLRAQRRRSSAPGSDQTPPNAHEAAAAAAPTEESSPQRRRSFGLPVPNAVRSMLQHASPTRFHFPDVSLPSPRWPQVTLPSLRRSSAAAPDAVVDNEDSAVLQEPFASLPMTYRENTPWHTFKDTIALAIPNLQPSWPGISWINSHSRDEAHPQSASPPSSSKAARSAETDGLESLSGNVLCLGGYRGSILRDTEGRRLWLPLKVATNLRKPSFTLGLSDQDELASVNTIRPGKMLMAVLGFLDLGKNLKDRLKAMDATGQVRFHNFGYEYVLVSLMTFP